MTQTSLSPLAALILSQCYHSVKGQGVFREQRGGFRGWAPCCEQINSGGATEMTAYGVNEILLKEG